MDTFPFSEPGNTATLKNEEKNKEKKQWGRHRHRKKKH